jgi:hypothetical protein
VKGREHGTSEFCAGPEQMKSLRRASPGTHCKRDTVEQSHVYLQAAAATETMRLLLFRCKIFCFVQFLGVLTL